MTRDECEAKIAEKLEEIKAIYQEYNPDGRYIHLSVTTEYISACNEYYLEDAKRPLDFRQYVGEELRSRPHGEVQSK